MDRLDKTIVFDVFIITTIFICVRIVMLLREFRRPIFLEVAFGLKQFLTTSTTV